MGRPRTAQLVSFIDAWLDQQAHEFDPFRWEVYDERQLRRKAVAEAALYLRLRRRYGARRAARRLNRQIVSVVNSDRFGELIRLYPTDLLLYATSVACVGEATTLKAYVGDSVRCTLASGIPDSGERVPYRSLDLLHFKRMFLRAETADDCHHLRPLTALGRPLQ